MKKLLTIEDIRNPKRKSGFDYVGYASSDKYPSKKPYQAMQHRKGVSGSRAIGPRRATAEEAAQDHCDHENGLTVPQRRTQLKSAGHKARRKPGRAVPAEVSAAYGVIRDYRARSNAQSKNYVYLIGEMGGEYVKIGESAKPEVRPAELQTGNPRTLILLGYYEVSTLRGADKEVHQEFAAVHSQNEWFLPDDAILARFNLTREEFLRRCGGKTKEVTTV